MIAPMYSGSALAKALIRRPSTVAVTGVALALTLLAARTFLPDAAALTAHRRRAASLDERNHTVT